MPSQRHVRQFWISKGTSVAEGCLDFWPKSILSQNQIGVLPLSVSFVYPVLKFPSKGHDVVLYSGCSLIIPVLKEPANNSH